MTRYEKRSKAISPILFALAFGAYAPMAYADQHEDKVPDHSGHMQASSTAGADILERMNHGMAVEPSGDADVDFARGMIPHHQGAIDMARLVLTEGDDPAIRKMAEEVIAAQESEIRFLEDWLKDNAPAR